MGASEIVDQHICRGDCMGALACITNGQCNARSDCSQHLKADECCRRVPKVNGPGASTRVLGATFVQRSQTDPKDSVFVHHNPSAQLLPSMRPQAKPGKAVGPGFASK